MAAVRAIKAVGTTVLLQPRLCKTKIQSLWHSNIFNWQVETCRRHVLHAIRAVVGVHLVAHTEATSDHFFGYQRLACWSCTWCPNNACRSKVCILASSCHNYSGSVPKKRVRSSCSTCLKFSKQTSSRTAESKGATTLEGAIIDLFSSGTHVIDNCYTRPN